MMGDVIDLVVTLAKGDITASSWLAHIDHGDKLPLGNLDGILYCEFLLYQSRYQSLVLNQQILEGFHLVFLFLLSFPAASD